jgi:hypothetical protein
VSLAMCVNFVAQWGYFNQKGVKSPGREPQQPISERSCVAGARHHGARAVG